MRVLPLLVLCAACASTPVKKTPTPAQQLVVVNAVSNLGLFDDEELRARDALARWFSAHEMPAADSSGPVFKGLALARDGKHPLTGVSCGRPLGRFEAARRWKVELGIDNLVSTNVQCLVDAACELNVQTLRLEETGAPLSKWTAPIDEKSPALDAFERALPALAVPAPRSGGGPGMGLLAGKGAGVVATDAFEVRVFHADLRARSGSTEVAQPFPGLTNEEVLACMGPEDNSDGVLFEVGNAGDVTRCEVDDAHPCLCELISTTVRSPELSDSRWNARFHITRRDRLTANGLLTLSASSNRFTMKGVKKPGDGTPSPLVEMVSDPSIRGWTPPSERLLAGCFENRTQAGRISSRWLVTFDDLGKVTKVEAVKTAWPVLDVDTAACVARLLRTSLAPCPARTGLSAHLDVHVTLGDPNASSLLAP